MASAAEVTPYAYEPLPESAPEERRKGYGLVDTSKPKYFRLLSLSPGSGGDPIAFGLHLFSVTSSGDGKNQATADGPQYETVSYTWLGDKTARMIWCDDKALTVSSVVHEMLSWLRRPDSTRWLWIDAICIDQGNLGERASQVSFMRLIYTAASRTLVWLGPAHLDGNNPFTAVQKFTRIRDELHLGPNVEDAHIRSGDPANLKKIKQEFDLPDLSTHDRDISALVNILEHGYFERIWIVQEVTVSNDVVAVKGHAEVSWSDFSDALLLAYQLRMDEDWTQVMSSNLGSLHLLKTIRHRFTTLRDFMPLRLLLNAYRRAKATDPRDKVYALAGISHYWSMCVPELMSYETSIANAYTTWTVAMLDKEDSLEVLSSAVRYPKSSELGLPGWVPDWSYEGNAGRTHTTGGPEPHLQATASSKLGLAQSDFTKFHTVIGLTGHIIDQVEEVGLIAGTQSAETVKVPLSARWRTSLQDTYLLWTLLKNWESIARLHQQNHYTPTDESMTDAYWQTLTYGELGYNPEAIEQGRREYVPFRLHFLRFSRLVNAFWLLWMVCFALYAYYRMATGRHLKNGVGQWVFMARWTTAGGWRRMIRTKKGYIGLGSYGVEVGDTVALFKGGRIPLVIRQVGGQWRLTGDAYIHGAMQGELWKPEDCDTFWIH